MPPEARELAVAAVSGDRAAAEALVIWGDVDDQLGGERLGAVRAWVGSTFAVFALNPRECPAGA